MNKELPAKVVVNQKINIISLIRGVLLKKGYKHKADEIVKEAITKLKSIGRFKKSPKLYLRIAVNKVRPNFELKSKKVAALKLKIPAYLTEERSRAYAIKWIIEGAEKRRKKTFGEALADEIIDAVNSTGSAYNKKLETYKEVDQSRMNLKFLK